MPNTQDSNDFCSLQVFNCLNPKKNLRLPREVEMAAAIATTVTDAREAPVAPVREQYIHKNRLQEHAQRSNIGLPVYQTVNEGSPHQPRFRSTVSVDGQQFKSPNTFSRRKDAEQDVAKLAYETLMSKVKNEGAPQIDQEIILCKSILHEYAVKSNVSRPSYTTIQPKGPLPTFVGSVLFDEKTYTGDVATNKKDAEQKAARAAIKSILTNSETSARMSEIIKSKERLFSAIKSTTCNSGSENLTASTSPEASTHPLPTSNGQPTATAGIVFTQGGFLETAFTPSSGPFVATAHQGNNADVLIGPSTQSLGAQTGVGMAIGPVGTGYSQPAPVVVSRSSKKRKKKANCGPQPKEARTA